MAVFFFSFGCLFFLMYLSKYSYVSVLQYFLALIFNRWLFFHLPILNPIFLFQVSSSLSEKTDGRYSKYRNHRDAVQQRRDDTRYRIKSFKVMFFIYSFVSLVSLTIFKSIQLISSCGSVCVRVLGKGKIPLDFSVIIHVVCLWKWMPCKKCWAKKTLATWLVKDFVNECPPSCVRQGVLGTEVPLRFSILCYWTWSLGISSYFLR